MVEPEKPFACTIPECRMTFTNEDHLHVHTKKHDMVLQLGSEQKAAFVADQTPTPTRFIRNCEEVGLFQDLQNVNPFDEGFKRAMETKHGMLSLESAMPSSSSSDDLHTPQMVFPLIDGDSALYSTTNNQRNITISRSSSDESGAIKEFETTTISKLTNEVTTISRIVGKADDKQDDKKSDSIRKDSVSFTNNVIKIHSNLVRNNADKNQTLIYEDTVIKDSTHNNIISKDTTDRTKEIPPIMSQKSLDFIVDSLTDITSDESTNKTTKRPKKDDEDYEVIIKLPNGRQVRMRSVEEVPEKVNAKEILKKTLTEKVGKNQNVNLVSVPNVVPITTGTLIPVTLVNPSKVPIAQLKVSKTFDRKPVKRKSVKKNCDHNETVVKSGGKESKNSLPKDLDSRSAASRRYRARLKETMLEQSRENQLLRETNERLNIEQSVLKMIIMDHMKKCTHADDLRNQLEKLKNTGSNV